MKAPVPKKSFATLMFGKVIIPLSYYLKGDLRFKYFKEYKKNLTKSKKEIQDFQLARLKALVRHAYDTVPYYKELFDKNGIKPEDIKKIEDLKKIPPLDKKTVMDQADRLKSTKKYKLIKAFSGGSTGNKITVFKDKRYYEISAAVRLRDLYSVGIDPGDKCAWVWFDTFVIKSLKRKILDYLVLKINRRLWFDVDRYSDDKIAKWLANDFNRFKPDYIYGYAGTIFEMAKIKSERKIKTSPIKKIITTSERLENREFIENVFQCPVIDQYGCSEVLSIAFEDDNQVMRSRDDFVILEVNENNEIMLTPLESYGMPLLRYKPGDMGMIKMMPSGKSSSPLSEFNITIGRTYETLYDKKMEKVSGGLIKTHIEEENLDINEFQLVQKTLDLVELNIVKDKFTKEKSVERLKQIIKEVLGASKVKVNYLKIYPTEPNGKRIAFKCEISKQDEGMAKGNPSGKSSSPFSEFNITIGRTYETLYNKKMEKVSGGLIRAYVEDENLDINEFQLVQKTLDLVELNIVKDKFTKEKSVERLKQVIRHVLGASKIKVNYLKIYPTEPNGKRIAFKCEVKKPR